MDEKMKKEKKLVVNCDICDARKVNEEELKQFDHILVNADYVLVNQQSKSILNRFTIQWNIDEMVQLEDEEEIGVSYYNGSFEINGVTPCAGKRLLYVNGRLLIRPGTENVIKSFVQIYVNGTVSCPNSMSAFVNRISVNGTIEYYPDDYKELGKEFVLDRYFPIRAEEGGKYFVKKVEITDTAVDTALLIKKGVHFKTKEVYVLEEKLQDCIKLFDEEVQFYVIPNGYCFIKEDAVLNKEFLLKYGNRIYSRNSFIIEARSKEALQQLEGLHVNGTLYLSKEQMEELKQKDVWYKKLELIKGEVMFGKSSIIVYPETIVGQEEISFIQCAMVQLDSKISADEILKKICFVDCALVRCSRQQRAAVESVGRRVAAIDSGEGDRIKGIGEEGVQIVNADLYVL